MPAGWIVGSLSIMMRAVSRAPVLRAVGLVLALGFVLSACKRTDAPAGPPAQIIDTSVSFEELRADFDAHRGEPRFLTLLAPS